MIGAWHTISMPVDHCRLAVCHAGMQRMSTHDMLQKLDLQCDAHMQMHATAEITSSTDKPCSMLCSSAAKWQVQIH
jgi:hypothetical protein